MHSFSALSRLQISRCRRASTNKALRAIGPSYQPVTLYGEDKSRQLKFKLQCALAWLPSLPRLPPSPPLSLSHTQLDRFSPKSRGEGGKKRNQLAARDNTLAKHTRFPLLGKSQCSPPKSKKHDVFYLQFLQGFCFPEQNWNLWRM